jgi:hypothetical protein
MLEAIGYSVACDNVTLYDIWFGYVDTKGDAKTIFYIMMAFFVSER